MESNASYHSEMWQHHELQENGESRNDFPADLELEPSAWVAGQFPVDPVALYWHISAPSCNFSSCVHSAKLYNESEKRAG